MPGDFWGAALKGALAGALGDAVGLPAEKQVEAAALMFAARQRCNGITDLSGAWVRNCGGACASCRARAALRAAIAEGEGKPSGPATTADVTGDSAAQCPACQHPAHAGACMTLTVGGGSTLTAGGGSSAYAPCQCPHRSHDGHQTQRAASGGR